MGPTARGGYLTRLRNGFYYYIKTVLDGELAVPCIRNPL